MQKIKRLKNNSQFKRVAQISGTNIGKTKIWDKFVLKKVTRNNPCDFLNYFKSLKSRFNCKRLKCWQQESVRQSMLITLKEFIRDSAYLLFFYHKHLLSISEKA